jgi:hypothetical protein
MERAGGVAIISRPFRRSHWPHNLRCHFALSLLINTHTHTATTCSCYHHGRIVFVRCDCCRSASWHVCSHTTKHRTRSIHMMNAAQRLLARAKLISSFMIRNTRYYKLKGDKNPVPSVTTVLGVIDKPALSDWHVSTALSALKTNLLTKQRPASSTAPTTATATTQGSTDESSISNNKPEITFDLEWLDKAIATAKAAGSKEGKRAADFGSLCHDCMSHSLLERESESERERTRARERGRLVWIRYNQLNCQHVQRVLATYGAG